MLFVAVECMKKKLVFKLVKTGFKIAPQNSHQNRCAVQMSSVGATAACICSWLDTRDRLLWSAPLAKSLGLYGSVPPEVGGGILWSRVVPWSGQCSTRAQLSKKSRRK